jgi:hypothetical protein
MCSSQIQDGSDLEKMQACALLASLDLPLDRILGQTEILESLLATIEGTSNWNLAAEAASVLRAWTTGDARRIRLLYAHCVLPRILALLPMAIEMLNHLYDISKEEVVVREHWLGSLLLAIWAFVEEIPVAIQQLNKNKTIITLLSCAILDRRILLEESTVILLLQLLLCAQEDNSELFLDTPTAESVRLESLLDGMRATEPPTHAKFLATCILTAIRRETPNLYYVKALFATVEALSDKDPSKLNLEWIRDVLECLANMIPEVEFDGNGVYLRVLFKVVDKIGNRQDEAALAAGCLQRVFGCALNLLMSSGGVPALDTESKIQLWIWAVGTCVSRVRRMEFAKNTMPSLAELLRHCVLASLGDEYSLPYPVECDTQIRECCETMIDVDAVVANLFSIPAILFSASTDVSWLVDMVGRLFVKERPLRTILSVAETIEELGKRSLLEPTFIALISDNYRSVIKTCQGELETMDEDTRRDREDELEYITSTLDTVLSRN